jgi:hypothetical protein
MTGRTCQLCGREIPPGEWGYADGPLCHPDDPTLPDCYSLYTVYGHRPGGAVSLANLDPELTLWALLRTIEDDPANIQPMITVELPEPT